MNIFLITGLFLNTVQADPNAYVESQVPEIMGKEKPKNEIRLGLCGGLSCIVGLQLEYGTPKYTIGASSLILANSVFAQYNALSLNNDRFRAVVGLRALYILEAAYLASETLGITAYVGPEFHFKHLTLRVTAGGFVNEYGDIFPSYSLDLLYNFILK